MKRDTNAKTNTLYRTSADLQEVWEWFEHNILNGKELDARNGEFVYDNTKMRLSSGVVNNIPSKVLDLINGYIEVDAVEGNIAKWKANNGLYMAYSATNAQGNITMRMERHGGYVEFELVYDKPDYILRYIAYKPTTIEFKADSL